ncbi:MAG: hypothetical protein ACLFPJ_04825 [Candidatus Woesearchaeota archaeon]
MIYLLWFILPIILFLGILNSYTDIKYGKIRNKWILFSLIYGLLFYSIIFLYNFFTDSNFFITLIINGQEKEYSFFIQTLSNLLIAIIISFILWIYNVWSAADAKLFISFAFLTPIFIYTNDYIRYFPSVLIIINSIVLVFIYLFIQVLITNFKQLINSVKNLIKNPKKIMISMLMIFLMEWVFRFIMSIINIKEVTFFFIFFIILFTLFLGNYLIYLISKYYYYFFIILFLRLLFDSSIYNLDYVRNFFIIVLIFVFLRLLLDELSTITFSKKIHVNSLKKGMITEKLLIDNGEKIIIKTGKKDVPGKTFFVPSIEGFSDEDIKNLKLKYKKNQLDFDYININPYISFAPFLFIGTMYCIIFGNSIVSLLVVKLFLLFA